MMAMQFKPRFGVKMQNFKGCSFSEALILLFCMQHPQGNKYNLQLLRIDDVIYRIQFDGEVNGCI